jgi:hypothetical protein
MTHSRSLFALLLLFILTGCKKDPQEIFNDQKSGVVLICNEYYYDITLSNGEHLYFSGLDDKGNFINLTGNLAGIKKQPGVLNGTGAFIDNTGRILTNRHVVAPSVDKTTVKNNVNTIIENYARYIQSLQDSMSQRYSAIQEYAQENTYEDGEGETYTNLSNEEIISLQQEIANLKEQYVEAENLKNSVWNNILNDNFSIQLHSRFGIAYDGSNVNSWDDFMKTPCSMLRVSEDAYSDLALLQLNSKETPGGHYIFTIDNSLATLDNQLEINQAVYMIGYNYGMALAKTDNGICAQFTSGTVTQQPDGKRVTYSIPSMPGSSGSPVVDDSGRLVAINFAKSNDSDNFNFGIPLIRIVTFLR